MSRLRWFWKTQTYSWLRVRKRNAAGNGNGRVRHPVFRRAAKHKFGARKTVCQEGHPHPSALEASVCAMMHLRQRAKEIQDLKWIAPVDLPYTVAGKEFKKRWKVDFGFVECRSGIRKWAEAKGAETYDYKEKKKLWKQGAGPGPLEIWKGTHARPRIVEIVIPEVA